MKTIELDAGVEEFTLTGGGVLRFNPRDPNLYARFLEAEEQLQALEAQLNEKAKSCADTPAAVELIREADEKIKKLLDQVFGGDNDFHAALGGVSLLAVAANGKPVISNLLAALEEILTQGAAEFAQEKAAAMRGQ